MGESMVAEVLIIDDDTRLAAMLSDYLRSAGFTTRSAATGISGLQEIARKAPDAVILDVMLPDHDGFEICRRIRAGSGLPVLMLTAKGEETDRIVGLELGADDYLPKPFSPRELAARLKAILRRTRGSDALPPADVLRYGSLEIDRGQRCVRVEGSERALTGYQFSLLLTLAENAGRVLSRERLMELTKGEELEAFDRSIDVHVSRIRAAIEADPRHPRRIITLRGAGYIFARNQDDRAS
jgi:two-component system, OmpR family, phosphate regulon response regulator OmpR